jgi:NADH dehydrogenase/NADH:ubiquinone oxidoreductase subunit G
MKGIGACRLCLVEVEGGKAPVIACNTKVKEGMSIATNTERVREVRKFVIDLILSMHPLDCMTCTKAGVCNLQQYAYDFEIKESNFTRKKFGYPVDEANPFIKRDPEYRPLQQMHKDLQGPGHERPGILRQEWAPGW